MDGLSASPMRPNPMPMAGAGTAPGQPPFPGSSPMTMPGPNRGFQAAAQAKVQLAVRILTEALPGLGIETDLGRSVMRALNTLSKDLPAVPASQGIENSALTQMMMQRRQDAPLMDVLRKQANQMSAGPGGQTPEPAAA